VSDTNHPETHGPDQPHDHGDCSEVLQVLSAWIENDLPAVQQARVESHLAECTACRHCADELRATVLLLHDTASRPPDYVRHARLMQQMQTALDALE